MQYLKAFEKKRVFVYLPGGGVLRGTLETIAEDHLVVSCEEEKRGGEKVKVKKFVSRPAIQWVEADEGQRSD